MAVFKNNRSYPPHTHFTKDEDGMVGEYWQSFTEHLTTEENKMNLRTINLTLIDNNPNLKAADKIVFQKLNYITEHTDSQAQQTILMSGKVAEALVEHNNKRVKVIDKEIQRNTGRDVMLEPVEIFDLTWQVVRVA